MNYVSVCVNKHDVILHPISMILSFNALDSHLSLDFDAPSSAQSSDDELWTFFMSLGNGWRAVEDGISAFDFSQEKLFC